MSSPLRVVFTTVSEQETARDIARILVEEGLVACAQVESTPVHSTWVWQGKVESAAEWRLMLKTVQPCIEALRARLDDLHPYDIPEFVILQAEASAAYAHWVEGSCSS